MGQDKDQEEPVFTARAMSFLTYRNAVNAYAFNHKLPGEIELADLSLPANLRDISLWHNRLETDETGRLVLHFTARNTHELLSWVLSFGSQAEILAPEHLREAMARATAEAAALYARNCKP